METSRALSKQELFLVKSEKVLARFLPQNFLTMTPPRGEQRVADNMPSTNEPQNTENGKSNSNSVQIGPDLNSSKTPLDHKLYRQILLPNGLWCILIQDTVAMHQHDGPPADLGDENESDEEVTKMEEDFPNGDSEELRARDDDNDEDDDDAMSEDDDGIGIRDAAAALLVGVGSAYDPIECQGMAHFLEHLLFMGSKKYPGENEFGAFVSKHGGSDNAYTEFESTTYHFSIPQEFLWPALDRLAQHFVSPLLLESAVDRELQAIESEFQLNKPSDECRRIQLQCATSKPNHVCSKFGWGNLRSLRDIPRALGVDILVELRKFFDMFYYAANMRLVVMGAFSLDQLQARVEDIFKDIPALPRLPSPNFPLPVDPNDLASWDTISTGYNSALKVQGMHWDEGRSLGKIFRIVPTKDRHRITLTWPIPPQAHKWKGRPYEFVSHLMGHEGRGSLLSFFRENRWATGCEAGVGEEGQSSCAWLFSFAVSLSTDGLKEWKRIVDATYEYIGMLRMYSSNRNWPEWLHEEMKQMSQVSYYFSDEEPPEDWVTYVVASMAPQYQMPPEHVLDGFALLREFDPHGIQDLLDNYLIPTNMRIDLSSSSFGTYSDMNVSIDSLALDTWIRDLEVHEEGMAFNPSAQNPQVEHNFETLFWCSTIPAAWTEQWSESAKPKPASLPLSLPPPNPFVPTRFDLKELPHDDSHHPLLNATIKVCTAVGKKRLWFPATVVQYDLKNNRIRLSYENEEDHWHSLDQPASTYKPEVLTVDFEGSLDNKQAKFRIVSLALKGVTRKFGDETGELDHLSFPPVPPALPPNRLPKEISSSNLLRMWFLQDRNFHRPIAEFRLQVICASANETPLHRSCADLLVALLHDACLETSYLASVCELQCRVEATCSGFGLRFHGFDDKLLVLFEDIFKVFLMFRGLEDQLPVKIAPGRFESCLELLRREYTNSGMYVSTLSNTLRQEAIRTRLWSSSQKYKALANITVPVFAKTVSSILETFAIECLLHGNVTYEDAKRAKDLILCMVEQDRGSVMRGGLKRQKYPSLSVLRLPSVKNHTLITVPAKDPTEANTSVEVYVQIGKDNLKERVLIDVLVHIMEDPIFNQIRTRDQFGYDVRCDSRWSFGIMGIIFKVVSNVKSAEDIVERIDRFLLEFRKEILEVMKDEEFMEHLVAVCTQKLDMFNSMPEETDSYWHEILNGMFSWQVRRDEALEVQKLTKQDVLLAFDAWLNPEKDRKILAVQVIGGGSGEVSRGRPQVPLDSVGVYADRKIEDFHRLCKNQTWGRINAKLA